MENGPNGNGKIAQNCLNAKNENGTNGKFGNMGKLPT